jgi:hypothetical protein
LNLPAYPNGEWVFNPFAWQLLFVFGAWCALGGAAQLDRLVRSPVTLFAAVTYLAFAFLIALTWHIPRLGNYVPPWIAELLYPIDKTNLDVLRFAHFLALTAITVRFVPKTWPGLQWSVFRPLIICGQHSLEIFCLGVFLAFAGHFAMVELSGSIAMQFGISVIGILIMVAIGALISWYKAMEGRRPARSKAPDADLAGGEA